MKTLLIIDGNAMAHRAFHALPPLSDENGNPVNAVYGFFSMLLKLIEDIQPFYIVVCFDRPAPTFRKGLYVGYQAHRPKMSDDLSGQILALHTALQTAHIVIFEQDGYEADDLIGTLSYQANAIGDMKTIIVTGDRDLLQLVNDKTVVFSPISGITKMAEFTPPRVEEKFGIKPSQITDYKALVGDSSDGYPGITGIGPKIASTLLQKYETFENLYKNLGDIKPRISEKLAVYAEQGALAKQLATIILDAPVHLDVEKAQMAHITKEDMYAVCSLFGFESLKKRIADMKILRESQKSREQLTLM